MTTMTPPAATSPTPDSISGHAVQFVQPLPGFESATEFTLQAIDDKSTLFSMRAVADPSIRFVLTPSDCFFNDYLPELDDEVATGLGLDDGDEVTLLLMLTIPSGLEDATANLRAPIVVSNSSGRAVQVILEDETLPMSRRLVA
jgi:flagellar assembly factor FliW